MPERGQEHQPDPIDRGLDRMHRVIESQIDPRHAQDRASAIAHLTELKALQFKRDKGMRLEAKISATEQAEPSADAKRLDELNQEQLRIEQEIEALTQEMRKLGNELGKYMSRDEAIPYITGDKSIGTRQRIGALFLGKIGNSNVLIEKLRAIHGSREQLQKQKEEIAKQIGRQETIGMMQ
ncbi:hypothetical protein KJ673_02900 [Patescibacteria group bacterium]|nr:hypothetical protein [Patescibacteria group bacterium]